MNDCDVIVVGAGHNGLVAAFYLARAGLKVHVCESRPFAGGGTVTEELWDGFWFSTCAHMVHGIHPKVIREMRLRELGLNILPRLGSWQFTNDQTYWGPVDHESPRNLNTQLTAQENHEEEVYRQFGQTLKTLFAPYRLHPPPNLSGLGERLRGTDQGRILETATRTSISQLRADIFKSKRLHDKHACDQAAIGRDPLSLCLGYGAMDQPEEETGEKPPNGYVQGGTGELTRILLDACQREGVEVHLNAPVETILIEDHQVQGVGLADGRRMFSRGLISSADPKRTLTKLVDQDDLGADLGQRIGEIDSGVSCMKLLAAVSELPRWSAWDGEPDRPSRGVVALNRADEASLDSTYARIEAGWAPHAPMINVSMPSAVDSSLAPDGYHTASIWIYPAPYRLQDGNWSESRHQIAEQMIDQINRHAPNFRQSIVNYHLRTPEDIEAENAMTQGSIWHVSHDGSSLFDNRPLPELAQYRVPSCAGFYLGGSGQHPGGEVSGLPGHNASQQLLRDWDILSRT